MNLDAAALAAMFGLGRPLGPWRPLANGGAPSDSRVLTTTHGRWVVRTGRLLGDWHREQAHRVHRLESAAWDAGIAMPRPVEPPAPAVGHWHNPAGDTLVRVSEWLEEHDLRQVDMTSDAEISQAAEWVGSTLARIALLGAATGVAADDGMPPHPPAEWREWVAEADAGGHPVATPARALLPVVEEATALIQEALCEPPGTAWVHGDTSRANVLRTRYGYALIDWEGARSDAPWWEAVNVAFRFATPFNGPTAAGDPRVVRPLLTAYLDAGGPSGPAEVSAFAGMLRSQLAAIAWCLWLALGHLRATADQRAFGLRIVTSAARDMPQVMNSLETWTTLLR
ncbi:aminoglycoside phosphotransferase family protein [Streptomyces rochei]|uniref:aminoglycoside phosphotransferase family protein n=1 Tax=Streptomyces rochei TaxID=1928 RepID=UPI0036453C4C